MSLDEPPALGEQLRQEIIEVLATGQYLMPNVSEAQREWLERASWLVHTLEG